jgi:16S rRNA (guanine527-N7)-methyltransferase
MPHPRSTRRRRGSPVDPERFGQDLARLVQTLSAYSIDLDEASQARLLDYSHELLVWNRKHNLLSRSDEANLVRKHIAASLGVFLSTPHVSGQRWIDVGTGAGFPGLVLQLALPEVEMTLLDSSGKRCEFLRAVTSRLSPGTHVVNQRAEDFLSSNGGATYDVVTTKAVATLGDCIQRFGALVRPGGRMITFKGPSWTQELEEAQRRRQLEGLAFVPESAVRVPWVEAHIVALFRR